MNLDDLNDAIESIGENYPCDGCPQHDFCGKEKMCCVSWRAWVEGKEEAATRNGQDRRSLTAFRGYVYMTLEDYNADCVRREKEKLEKDLKEWQEKASDSWFAFGDDNE